MDTGHLRAAARARNVVVALAALGLAAPAAQAERPGSAGPAGSPPQANGAPGHAAPNAPGRAEQPGRRSEQQPGGRSEQQPGGRSEQQPENRSQQPARPQRAHGPRPAPAPRGNPRPPRRATPAPPARPSPRAQGPKRGRGHGRNDRDGQTGASSTPPRGAAHQKTTICHATGSASNPYVQITISDRALKAHARHQDGRDLIPAPATGCPGAAATLPQAVTAVPRAVNAAATRAAQLGQRPGRPSRAQAPSRGQVEVLAAAANRSARGAEEPTAADGTPRAVTATRDRGSLPFTGLEALLVAALGAGLVGSGIAARRALGRRAAG